MFFYYIQMFYLRHNKWSYDTRKQARVARTRDFYACPCFFRIVKYVIQARCCASITLASLNARLATFHVGLALAVCEVLAVVVVCELVACDRLVVF